MKWQQYIRSVWRCVQIWYYFRFFCSSSIFAVLCVQCSVSTVHSHSHTLSFSAKRSKSSNWDIPRHFVPKTSIFQACGSTTSSCNCSVTLNIINTRENWYQRWPSTHERFHCWHTVNHWFECRFRFRFDIWLSSLIFFAGFSIHFNGSAWIFYLHINTRDGLFVCYDDAWLYNM